MEVAEGSKLLVEGGGSHTRALITSGDRVLAQIDLPTLNRVGQTDCSQLAIFDQLASLICDHGKVVRTYLALGAAATNAYLEVVVADLQEIWRAHGLPWQNLVISNDIVPILFSSPVDANQLVTIAGTGTGMAARVGFDRIVRCGAHEYLLGDDGGAFDIGRRGLRAVIEAGEGRGLSTALEDLAREWSQGEEIDWFVYESPSPKQTIAAFAPAVFQADRLGDPVARGILDDAADALTTVSQAALGKLGNPPNVVVTCTGTLLCEETARLRTRFEHRLSAQASIHHFETCVVTPVLMAKTCDELFKKPFMVDTIGSVIPIRAFH